MVNLRDAVAGDRDDQSYPKTTSEGDTTEVWLGAALHCAKSKQRCALRVSDTLQPRDVQALVTALGP
jgi:hypothetical protein